MAFFHSKQTIPSPETTHPFGPLLSDAFPDEMVRGLRRMITQISYQRQLPKRLSLVATASGEGVTCTTLALASTLASDVNVRVCAVELNWWSPGMLRHIQALAPAEQPWVRRVLRRPLPVEPLPDVADTSGLAGVVLGTTTLRDAMMPTVLPNLAFLPAGNVPLPLRPAVTRGAELRACIDELCAQFDHVLFDIPAIGISSDAIALASLGDSCCAVVRQGVTSVAHVRQALADVQHLPMLGVIVNRSQTHTPRWIQALLPQE